MTPQSLLESANSFINAARSSRKSSFRKGSSQQNRGSRGPRPVWPRQLLSLLVGTPARAAEHVDTAEVDTAKPEANPPVIMAAMGSRRRGRGPRPIEFPRRHRRG